MIYQSMFAIIPPALIAGAFAERVRFGAMIVFSTLIVPLRVDAQQESEGMAVAPHGEEGYNFEA